MSSAQLFIKDSYGIVIASKSTFIFEPYISGQQTPARWQPVRYSVITDCQTPVGYTWSVSGAPYYSINHVAGNNYADITFNEPGAYTVNVYVMYSPVQFDYCTYQVQVGRGGNVSPFTVYPNPVNDILYIDIDQQAIMANNQGRSSGGKMPVCEFHLYSVMGVPVIRTSSSSNSVQLNVSNIPDGMYFLHLYDGFNHNPEIKTILI